VRAAVAVTLGRLSGGAEQASDALVAAAGDPDPLVRACAVRTLGRVRSPAADAAVARALADADGGVRAEAAKAQAHRPGR